MINLFSILVFISLYGVSIIGGKRGVIFYIFGLLFHIGYIIYRGLVLGRLPITERHDILLVVALIVALSFFYMYKKISLDIILSTLPLFVVIFCFFGIFQERIDTIEPHMNSKWFYIYMILFILGYSLLTIGSIAGIFYLREKAILYEAIQYRLTLLGWLLFSFSLIAGSVWFYLVYGVYWIWTAKELWTTIAWFYYSFYLHGRMIELFKGRPASLLGSAGFVVLIFSYIGVMPVLGSPWIQF